MNKQDIINLRLFNQRLKNQKFKTVEEAVIALGAVQAQDYEGALWSIASRVANATEKEVEQAIADRTILRTWPMRGTLHFVPAKDAKWMLRILAPKVIQKSESIYKKNDLTQNIFNKSANAIVKALTGGKQLTRAEMYDALNLGGVATKGMKGVLILGELAMEGLICFGEKKKNQQTFTLLEEWVTEFNDYENEQGFAILAERFFKTHGPATVKDFAWWCGITMEEANAAVDTIKSEFSEETVDGQSYFYQPVKELKETDSAYLLQGYDEYTIPYRNNIGMIVDGAYAKDYVQPNGFTSMFIINGKIAGTWKKTVKPDKVVVHCKPFYALDQSQKLLLATAAEDYGKFIGLPVVFIV